MSEYIIHNIGLTVVPQFDFDENEEKDKPVSLFPNFYLGKIIGKKGSELSINRTRRGEGEEHIPNCVLRNENGIALIRIHNKENLTIYDLPDSTEKEVQDCIYQSLSKKAIIKKFYLLYCCALSFNKHEETFNSFIVDPDKLLVYLKSHNLKIEIGRNDYDFLQ